ncbi:MAG: hypothetical protein ACJAUP_002761 [Cellvibrionaceae bacterium]|jgi:hypothetical protein
MGRDVPKRALGTFGAVKLIFTPDAPEDKKSN